MIACRFEDCLRDAGIELTHGGREARLAPTVLFHNEESQKLALRDEITPALWAKVLFDLPSPGKIREATLLWFVNQPPADSDAVWTILVNGHKIAHQQRVARLLTGGWDRCAVPGRFLKSGRNEVVFAGHGWLYLESAARLQAGPSAFSGGDLSESTLAGAGAGGRSLRSFDGGRTWHFNASGPNRNQPGEYLVRLRAMGHPVAGSLTSPVADLGDPDGAGRIAPVMEIRSCRLEARRSRADRNGRPLRDAQRLDAGVRSEELVRLARRSMRLERPGRFVQWRATLSSRRLDATPVVSRVALKPDVRVAEPADDCRIAHWDRPELARSSYAFRVDGAEPARAAPGPAIPPGGSDRARQDRSRTPLPPARLVLETVVRLAEPRLPVLPVLGPVRNPRHGQEQLGLRHVHALVGALRRLRRRAGLPRAHRRH